MKPNISFLKVEFWKFDIAMKGLWGCTKKVIKEVLFPIKVQPMVMNLCDRLMMNPS
jgi:hypothetical protein